MGQLVGGITQGFGSIMGGIGDHMSAQSAANAAMLNGRLAHAEGDAEAERTLRAGRRTTGLNITRVAKSGVRLEGSPLEVLVANAGEVKKQSVRQQRLGLLVLAQEKARANQAKKAGVMGLVGGLIGGGAAVGQGISDFQTAKANQAATKGTK